MAHEGSLVIVAILGLTTLACVSPEKAATASHAMQASPSSHATHETAEETTAKPAGQAVADTTSLETRTQTVEPATTLAGLNPTREKGEAMHAELSFTDRSGINDPYAEQSDATRWVAQFENDAREAKRKKAEILAQLEIQPGTRIADIGAGTGLYTLDFARQVGPKGLVYAVDVQDYFLKHIAKMAKKSRIKNVKTVRATHVDCGLAPDSIDLAFLMDTYHHIEHAREYMGCVKRALGANSRLVIVDYDPEKVSGDRGKWLKDHVRSTPEQTLRELGALGFRELNRYDYLEENFFFVLAPS
jgi:ubiquinone/menaquinone biosynthesis C-methylase UbiE